MMAPEFPETGDDLMKMATEILDNLPEWWQIHPTTVGMGAEGQFDYAYGPASMGARLSNCYQLAGDAFLVTNTRAFLRNPALMADGEWPMPQWLVHGSWHGPEAPERITHAWVILSDGRIWEPITACVYDAEKFMRYARAEAISTYNRRRALKNMHETEHYGPWGEK